MKIRLSFALNRQSFKDKVAEKLTGALFEYYKARIAEANGISTYVQHWDSEVFRLVDIELVSILARPIRGFKDREKPLLEILREFEAEDIRFQRGALKSLQRSYGFDVQKVDLTEASNGFFRHVRSILDDFLS